MDPENPIDPVDRIELPESFYSEETGERFTSCVECGLPLEECLDGYIVQKCSNGRETVFEFALCLACSKGMHESYSDESRAKIQGFFTDRVDIGARYDGTWFLPPADFAEHLLGHCLTCGEVPEPGKPVTRAAICDGGKMLVGHSPICLCSNCEEAVNTLVSKETRDEWDKFIGRNFDLPPSDALVPDGRPVLIL